MRIPFTVSGLHHRLRVFRHVVLRKGEPELRLLPGQFGSLDVAIDVGANNGVYSEVLSRLARTVITLEPNARCAAWLKRVLKPNCIVVQKAASDRCAEEVLRVPCYQHQWRDSRGTIAPGNVLSGPVQGIEKQKTSCAPLDQIVGDLQLGARRIGFIKIDVEGHEHAVLRGAEGVIRAHRPTVLVETEVQHGAPVAEIFSLMAASGYRSQVLMGDELVAMDADTFLHAQRTPGPRFINNVFFLP